MKKVILLLILTQAVFVSYSQTKWEHSIEAGYSWGTRLAYESVSNDILSVSLVNNYKFTDQIVAGLGLSFSHTNDLYLIREEHWGPFEPFKIVEYNETINFLTAYLQGKLYFWDITRDICLFYGINAGWPFVRNW